ncbi:WD40 repeat domain-containing protein [Reichenbachiella versicolor]|uniref:WD40 repeat domain-containing protein n=1 Tax=Reichenbachiella versicolor TaxID=1821036 RepID=UPI000D6E2162|nr:hypothetical protein [Reichenbachiella versicolor]
MKSTITKPITKRIVNPFPGLRPFKPDESDLFFGREKQVKLVIDQLLNNKFIAIVGASGVGKSSFISCGLLSELPNQKENSYGKSWNILSMTPGKNPIKNLAECMFEIGMENKKFSDIESLENSLLNNPESFNDIVEEQANSSNTNYLLFIDQFEEIFRFNDDDETGSKSALSVIDIIVSSLSQIESPIYIVLAVRADFIGDCAKFPRLTKIINNSQYLIPQLTKEEKREAIVGPIKFRKAKIKDSLVDLILDEMGESSDQLPIMQHAMMRTWSQWSKLKPPSEPITKEDYESIGGMQNALSEHAREAYRELEKEDQKICQKIFKTLTEKGDGGRGVRRPTQLSEICEIVNADKHRIVKIVDFFRSPSRSLLLPPAGTDLKDETVIDISHESLMRNWVELSEWVDDEAESVKLYKRLAEAAIMHQEGKAGLWVPPDLLLAQDWYKKQKPSVAWGLMHNKAFESTILFLEHSESEYERAQILKEKVQRRRIVIFRRIAAVMFLLTLAAGWSWITARESAKIAENKKLEAIAAQEEAENSAKAAERARVKAKLSEQLAKQSELVAKQKEELARVAKIEADSNAVKAENQKKIALEKQKEATELRLLSIAKSMAIKSKEIENDKPQKKSLVAKQAYNFYESIENTGKTKKLEKDPDIYDGLYYSLKSLQDESIFNLSEHEQNVRSIVGAKNGDMFSTGSDGNIIRWKKNKFHSYIKKNESGTRINKSLALNNKENLLACSGNFNFIEVYDLKSNNKSLKHMIPTEWTDTWHLAFTPKNNLVCIGSNNQLMLYDLDLDKFTEITYKTGKINAVAVHPEKDVVLVGWDNGLVEEYDLNTKHASEILTSPSSIYTLVYSQDGRYIAVGDEKGKVYLKTPIKTVEFPGHSARVNQIAFDHQNHFLATASFDKTVRIWNILSKDDAPIILKDHQDWVWSIAFTQDDKYLWAGSRDYLIKTWPLDLDEMAANICPNIHRKQLTQEEWIHYAGEDFSEIVNSTCD